MAWFPLHQSLKDHRKLLRASEALDIDTVYMMGHIVSFWMWALDNAPGGELADASPRMIAHAAQYKGNAPEFVEALIQAGFIDVDDRGIMLIHDWYEYVGKLSDQRAAEKERSQRRRDQAKNEKPEEDATGGRPGAAAPGQPPVAQQTTGGRPTVDQKTTAGTLHNTTLHNTTVQENDTPPIPPSEGEEAADAAPVCVDAGEPKSDSKGKGKKPKEKPPDDPRFEVFWKLFPHKVGKGEARNSWAKINPSQELFERIMAAVEDQSESRDWQKDGGQYIPHPSTWLNQGRWDDELPKAQPQAPPKPQREAHGYVILRDMLQEGEFSDDGRDSEDHGSAATQLPELFPWAGQGSRESPRPALAADVCG